MATNADLIKLAGMKTNLIISANYRSTADLISIAGTVGRSGGHLTLIDLNVRPILDLMQIVSLYPEHVTLDFTTTTTTTTT
jgi:hypothetical protein